MKIRLLFKYLIIFLIPLSIIQPVKADLASDLLKMAGDAAAKNKAEYAKWGLKSSKDIKKLKSKEIKLLLDGNILEGNLNDNENQGKFLFFFYKDGTYKGTIAGESLAGKWYIKEGKLCYKGNPGCSKIYKSKSEQNVYYQKQQGVIFTKLNKVGSIEEVEKIKKVAKEKKLAKKKAAKEKKLAEEKVAKEKKLSQEKAAKEKKLSQEKVAKEKLEKKLSLLPPQTDLEKAQNFLISVKSFVKLNPDEFDIVKISEFLISTKPISEGNLDDVLKNSLKLFQEFTNSSNEFVKFYETKESMKKDKEIEKIDQIILSLEQNIKTLKEFLINNSDSIYVAQWVEDMKKANDILKNASNYDELVNENKRLTSVIFDSQKIDKVKIDAKLTIVELKENLKLNLTSDLAPLIIEQVKSLEQAIKEENIKEITLADKIAKEFIFKQFEEPKLKAAEEKRIADAKAAEEKRIADAKAAEEYKKSPEGIKEEKERVEKEKERIAEEKRLANFKPVFLNCTTTITGAGGTKVQTFSWNYDGRTVSFQGFPVAFGKRTGENGGTPDLDYSLFEKIDGKDKFRYTRVYLFKTVFTIDFYNRVSYTEAFGAKFKGQCY